MPVDSKSVVATELSTGLEPPNDPSPSDLRTVAPSFAPRSTHTPPSSDVRVIQNPQVKAFTEIGSETRFGQK